MPLRTPFGLRGGRWKLWGHPGASNFCTSHDLGMSCKLQRKRDTCALGPTLHLFSNKECTWTWSALPFTLTRSDLRSWILLKFSKESILCLCIRHIIPFQWTIIQSLLHWGKVYFYVICSFERTGLAAMIANAKLQHVSGSKAIGQLPICMLCMKSSIKTHNSVWFGSKHQLMTFFKTIQTLHDSGYLI